MEAHDLTAYGELAEQEGGRLVSVPGVDRAEDLGPPGYQLQPGGVFVLGELGRNARSRAGSASEADGPVGLAEPLGIELADHPNDPTIEQPSVPAGDRLFGGPEDFGQPAERRPRIDVESMDDPSVKRVDHNRSHAGHRS